MWNERDRIRLAPLVRAIHRLGERPLFEFLNELCAGDEILSADIEHQLHRYSKLEPRNVEALGARDLVPPLVVIEGGRR